MTPLGPGAAIGVLGGGQLARMLALEARRMGYRVGILDPDPAAPAVGVSDFAVTAPLDDLPAAERLAQRCDVLTVDTEHVPAALLERLAERVPTRPGAHVLRVIQDRALQRRFLRENDVPQPAHADVSDQASLRAAGTAVGYPCVLKSRTSGYDGRGQARVAGPDELEPAWERIGHRPAVLEAWVDYEREISVVLARGLDGGVSFYPVAWNEHRAGVLRLTRVPAGVDAPVESRARAIAATIAERLDAVGVLAVECYLRQDGEVLVNEIAPRTHNSGHFTFGGCATSQFEQHVRAICGLPLGDPSLLRPAVMLNLFGDLWTRGVPDWTPVHAHPNARLHLYGKSRAFPGRKMGHVLILDEDADRAYRAAEAIAAALEPRASAEGAA